MKHGRYTVQIGLSPERPLFIVDLNNIVRQLKPHERAELTKWLESPILNATWQQGNVKVRCVEVFE